MSLNLCIDHDFAMWAFGETWIDFLTYDADNMDLMNAWNRLHGEKMLLNPAGLIHENMKTMKQIWSKYGQENTQDNREHEEGRKGYCQGQPKGGFKGSKGCGKAK